MTVHKPWLAVAACAVLAMAPAPAGAQPVSPQIKLDNFGYRPADAKVAIFTANPGATVQVRDAATLAVAVHGAHQRRLDRRPRASDGPARSTPSGGWTSRPSRPSGATTCSAPPWPASPTTSSSAATSTARSSAPRSRATTASAATRRSWPRTPAPGPTPRPATWATRHDAPRRGTPTTASLDLTGGWHDAGDYNKYVWGDTGGALLFLLRAYERNPAAFGDDTGIPESGNGVPDVLDEVKWELDWLLKMQLPDGSVLSRTHVAGFASDSPPSADANLRFYHEPERRSRPRCSWPACALASRVFAAGRPGRLRAAAEGGGARHLAAGAGAGATSNESKVWAAAEVFRMDPTITAARAVRRHLPPRELGGRLLQRDELRHPGRAGLRRDARGDGGGGGEHARVDVRPGGLHLQRGRPLPERHAGLVVLLGIELDPRRLRRVPARGGAAGRDGRRTPPRRAARTPSTSCTSSTARTRCAWSTSRTWRRSAASTRSGSSTTRGSATPGARTRAPTTSASRPRSSSPRYPYFAGTDNHGVNDNKSSTLGPAPGILVGGPNKDYGGDAAAAAGRASASTASTATGPSSASGNPNTWEITENSIKYQGPYVSLASAFAAQALPAGLRADPAGGARSDGNGVLRAGGDGHPGARVAQPPLRRRRRSPAPRRPSPGRRPASTRSRTAPRPTARWPRERPRDCLATGDCYRLTVGGARPGRALGRVGRGRRWPPASRATGCCTSATASRTCRGRTASTASSRRCSTRSVTGGCTATAYCPQSGTTREQMAVFVLVAKEGDGYAPPACTTPMFSDVPASSPFCRWVEELARRGVVSGCGGGAFCPGARGHARAARGLRAGHARGTGMGPARVRDAALRGRARGEPVLPLDRRARAPRGRVRLRRRELLPGGAR